MAKINEIKEQKVVVESVGGFAGSLQQIAAGRMVTLRKLVLASRRFVDETTMILRELKLEQRKLRQIQLEKAKVVKKAKHRKKQAQETSKEKSKDQKRNHAIIVISSSEGLCGVYNTEIFKKVDEIVAKFREADYFVIGSKGQEYFRKLSRKMGIKFYPYNISEEPSIDELQPLIKMFNSYQKVNLIYSKYINTVTREVIFLDLAIPNIEVSEEDEKASKEDKMKGKFIFEPSVDELIKDLSLKLRYALFRQQILDSKLSLYTAQMIAMQTASENAEELLSDLQKEYNKQRRKMIDKKIQEVQAGRSLWADEEGGDESKQMDYIPI